MNKRTAICEHLQKNHTGKAKAVHREEPERLFCIDGRNLRRKISAVSMFKHRRNIHIDKNRRFWYNSNFPSADGRMRGFWPGDTGAGIAMILFYVLFHLLAG